MHHTNSESTRPSKAAEHHRTPRRWRAVPRVGPGEAFGVRWQAERDTALGWGRGAGCADEKAPSPLRSAGALQDAGTLATVDGTSARFWSAPPPLRSGFSRQVHSPNARASWKGLHGPRSEAVPAASCGGVSPPARTPGGTPGELAGEDACATSDTPFFPSST